MGLAFSHSDLYSATMPSQWSCGNRPRLAAASAIFSPCSSVPVTNRTRRPRSRCARICLSLLLVREVASCVDNQQQSSMEYTNHVLRQMAEATVRHFVTQMRSIVKTSWYEASHLVSCNDVSAHGRIGSTQVRSCACTAALSCIDSRLRLLGKPCIGRHAVAPALT